MNSYTFKELYLEIIQEGTKLGNLRTIAKEIKKDHALAMQFWATNEIFPRLFAILIMDKKELGQVFIDKLELDIQNHKLEEQLQLVDWLMANQYTKEKKIITLMESWENSDSAFQRRVFWYYQGRLRWMGKTNQSNTEELLTSIEEKIQKEPKDEVQWAMNFTACQIGKWQEKYRARCISIGENTGLYKDDIVPRGCTPSYIPKFIEVELAKLNK